jgi:zinc protease
LLKVLCAVLITLSAMSSPLYAASRDKSFEKSTLPNGVAVLSQEYGEDLAAVCVFVRAGAADEPAGKNGVSNLLARALLSCDPLGKKNPAVLRVEQLGGRVSINTYCDFTCFTLVVPVDNTGPGLKALADALIEPDFSDAAFSIERDAMIADNEMIEDQPAQRAYRLLLQKTCSSFLAPEGENASVEKLKPGDLTDWHRQYYRPENVLVSVCGKLGAATSARLVDDAFKGWKGGGAYRSKPVAEPAGAGTGDGLFEEDTAGGGAAAIVGFAAPQIGSPDYPAVRLLEAALTDGMGASIFKELRDKDGLAYEFGSFMPLSKDWPRVAFYVVTDEGRLGPAVESIKKSISRVKTSGIGQEELARARGRVIGEMSIRRETALERAWSCGLYEFLGLGADYGTTLARQIEKLGSADLVKAAGKYLDRYTAVMLKPLKGRR